MNANSPKINSYRPGRPISGTHTLMWFAGGLALMFALISVAFVIKLAIEGRLPFIHATVEAVAAPKPATAPAAEAAVPATDVTPPFSAAAFNAGADNLIPADAARLNSGEAPVTAVVATTDPIAAAAPVAAPEGPTTALMAWAAAWEHKNADAYFAQYATDFKPANGLGLEAWKLLRRKQLDKPGAISVALSDIQVSRNGDKATLRFTQSYQSDKQSSREPKIVELALRDGRWLIHAEATDD